MVTKARPPLGPRRSHVEMLTFGSLRIDARMQRKEVPARVRYLVKNWELGKVGILEVARLDGAYFIINGQHRWRAAMELGLGDTKVRCIVTEGLTAQEAAALFLSGNDVRPVSAFDKFDIALFAGTPEYVGVDEILKSFGLHVAPHVADDTVRCPERLLTLYRRDPELLRDVIATAIEAWGTRADATEAVVLGALGTVLGKYNGQVDRGTLIKKLKKYKGGPGALVGNARSWAELRNLTISRAAAEVIKDTYDKGRRASLPPL